jgi:hypothetical protein
MPPMPIKQRTNNPAAIWERVVQFDHGLSPVAARALLKVRFSPQVIEEMNALASKARRGTLTPQEQVDLDTYERLGCLLDILHSQARMALKAHRTAS